MRTSGLWIHKDKPDIVFIGQYQYPGNSLANQGYEKRLLILVSPNKKQKYKFEGWQQAKAEGFVKL